MGERRQVSFVPGTPDLKRVYRQRSGSNAIDFVRLEEGCFSRFALVEGEPVGLIVAKKRPLAEPLQMANEVFIDIIEVLPEVQRQGIGTGLVEQAIEWARENRVVQVRAWSEEIRYEALMLWNKLGFAFSQVDFERNGQKRHGFYAVKRL